MSFGFFGIQFGFALQTGNASRILQTFGADVEHLSLFWLVAPLSGMLIQPIVGYFSDKTWTRLGRRRPFFLGGALVAAAALALMPNASVLTLLLPPLLIGAGIFYGPSSRPKSIQRMNSSLLMKMKRKPNPIAIV